MYNSLVQIFIRHYTRRWGQCDLRKRLDVSDTCGKTLVAVICCCGILLAYLEWRVTPHTKLFWLIFADLGGSDFSNSIQMTLNWIKFMALLSSMVTIFPSKGHLKLIEYYETYVNHMLDINNQITTQSITIDQLSGQILIPNMIVRNNIQDL